MKGWMGGRMSGLIHGCTHRWIDKGMDVYMKWKMGGWRVEESMVGWTSEWKNGWMEMNKSKGERMDG